MVFDNLGRLPQADQAAPGEGLNLLQLVNSRIDQSHGRGVQDSPQERREPQKTEAEILAAHINGLAYTGDVKGRDVLESTVGGALAKSGWDGDAAAAVLNKQLQEVGSGYRVQLDGPHKTQIPQDPKWPGLGSNIYHHLMTITDTAGNPVKNKQGEPVALEIRYIGNHSRDKQ